MRLIFVGYGTVARAVVGLLEERRARLLREHGLNPRIIAVVNSRGAAVSESGLDLRSEPEIQPGLTACQVMEECEAEVVVEATPTSLNDPWPSFERLKTAFRTGKHVVCVNKGPLAIGLPALRELAEFNRVHFRYSGTVGGGTPLIEWAREVARGDDVLGVHGVLNGTTNYILSRMQSGATFETALKEAQQLGYAEADPSADTDGIDTAVKLVIFANAVLDRRVSIRDVRIRGIRGIRVDKDRVVKLIGRIGPELSVQPEEIPADSPLNVGGVLNALCLRLRSGGEMTLVGRGAGGRETATAILRDLIWIWHEIWRSS